MVQETSDMQKISEQILRKKKRKRLDEKLIKIIKISRFADFSFFLFLLRNIRLLLLLFSNDE